MFLRVMSAPHCRWQQRWCRTMLGLVATLFRPPSLLRLLRRCGAVPPLRLLLLRHCLRMLSWPLQQRVELRLRMMRHSYLYRMRSRCAPTLPSLGDAL